MSSFDIPMAASSLMRSWSSDIGVWWKRGKMSISLGYGRSSVRCSGGRSRLEGRHIEIGGQNVREIVRKLDFFALFAQICNRDVEGVLFGLARFFFLSAFLRSKANFG